MKHHHTKKCTQIVISATQIPAILGKNKYKPIEKVFLDVWKRSNPQQYFNVKQNVSRKQNNSDGDSVGRHEEFDQERRFLNNNNRHRYIPMIDRHHQRKQYATTTKNQSCNKQYGKKNEPIAIDYYEHVNNTKVVSKGSYHERLFRNDALGIFSDIVINGKVDGLTEDDKVIEVKCRLEKFYDYFIDKEMVQLQTYLWICKKNQGQLVEYLPILSPAQRLRVKNVVYNHKRWTESITPHIETFATSLDLFMRNDELQKIFVQQPAKRKDIIRGCYVASKQLNQSFLGCNLMHFVLKFDLHRF